MLIYRKTEVIRKTNYIQISSGGEREEREASNGVGKAVLKLRLIGGRTKANPFSNNRTTHQ